jgi:hypothetical protein
LTCPPDHLASDEKCLLDDDNGYTSASSSTGYWGFVNRYSYQISNLPGRGVADEGNYARVSLKDSHVPGVRDERVNDREERLLILYPFPAGEAS